MSKSSPATHWQSWRLKWAWGSAEVQSLGAMLGPLTFRLDQQRDLSVLHVAPWAGTTKSLALPGILRRLRGEWPCVPFGRTDSPPDLPPGWQAIAPDDAYAHGFGANHHWQCDEASDEAVHLSIEYPRDSALHRIERVIQVVPDQPAIDVSLKIYPRMSAVLPAGLHPTFCLPRTRGRVKLELGSHEGIFSYPSQSAGDISLLLPDARSDSLAYLAGKQGTHDLSELPAYGFREELLQIRGLASQRGAAPLRLHYLDYGAHVGLWWDCCKFPDLMLWISNQGRFDFPWEGEHMALGAEPINSVFDLGRVACPPPDHALADRTGISLTAGEPWQTSYRIAAWCGAIPEGLSPIY